jgi:predicted nuclease of restriction endonuclease-like RecB superfamily
MGDVVIETAGTMATFTFKSVYDPSKVQEEVFNRMVVFQQRQREMVRDTTAEQFVQAVTEYHHLAEKSGVFPSSSSQ